MQMKRMMAAVVAAAGIGLAAQGQVTPDELLGAVDKMTPEQAQTLAQKLESKYWKPIPEGFFTRLAVDAGVTVAGIRDDGVSDLGLAGGDLDVDVVGGMDLGLFWRVFDPRFRLGLRMGVWGAADSDLTADGYSRADLTGSSLALAAHMQWVRNDRWLLWTELAPGVGSVRLELVDTPAGEATTLRDLDGGYAQVDIQAGLALRVNTVLTLFASGGYRWADPVDLEYGGEETDLEFDASGAFGRLGLGFNF